jgi:hypothetical protein
MSNFVKTSGSAFQVQFELFEFIENSYFLLFFENDWFVSYEIIIIVLYVFFESSVSWF